jgi:hypothetical protein
LVVVMAVAVVVVFVVLVAVVRRSRVVVVVVVVAVVVAVVVVAVVVVVVGFRKFSPSHIIPFGHGAHKSSLPGVAGKYHFNPVCASPFASSTGGAVQVQGVSAALFRL